MNRYSTIAGIKTRSIVARRALVISAVLCLVVAGVAQDAFALHERYHTHAEVGAELAAVAAAYPEITRLETLGYSTTDGQAIWGLKISDNVDIDEDEPVVLYDGLHHAEEVVGLEVCMWMIDELTSNYGVVDSITQWVDDIEIWFIPLLNPDGHWVVTSGLDTTYRKNIHDNNGNGTFELDLDGVDPNYNYDFNWAEGGSGEWTSPYYRGTAPFSENESQVVRDLCIAEKPVFALNYHSPLISMGDCIYYPWYWPTIGFCPDYDVVYSIALGLAGKTTKLDDTSYTAIYGYATAGKARNWQYGVLGTIGLTMEIMSQMCIPPGADVDEYCERVSLGSYYLLDRVYGPGLTGHVTDGTTGDPLVAEVEVIENSSDEIMPRLTGATYGRYWRMLVEGTYTVEFSSAGYDTQTFYDVVVGARGLTELDAVLWPTGTGIPDAETRVAGIRSVSPNPFCGSTTISFIAPVSGAITVEIYSVSGRLIDRMSATASSTGEGEIIWKGRDLAGESVSSGVYFARLVTETGTDQQKVVFIQ
jgi:hypothetical protein